jgi:hypothetical protein
MKAFNEMVVGEEAERKACKEKMMAEWEADKKKSRPRRSGGKAGYHSRQDRR